MLVSHIKTCETSSLKIRCIGVTLAASYCSYFSVVFGEDVAFGGVFRCTVGLRDKYGKLTFKSDIIFILASLFFCTPLWFVGEEKNMWERSLLSGLVFSFLSLEI